MRTHHRHIFMCVGPRCEPQEGRAQAVFEHMGKVIDEHPELAVKRTRTHCMVACRFEGPVVAVYPEGVWYQRVNEANAERIVHEHLLNGREVADLVFHRLGVGDTCEPGPK
ncbi:(2Fe-2S) ferredoxin domain-containing protein [Duganella phyllosphaerae]|uniref:Ferredoxin, 2Fe-2S n=1 Tax=Duganella phyllosphaerae TaxID=762836 RepID=A0A1E7X541_9BURK|nr:ferredoxin [Duganella phyllosphaerae]OFA07605.1 ferredoxin, 2Fe-2S [Duganella phyllosphaerae]